MKPSGRKFPSKHLRSNVKDWLQKKRQEWKLLMNALSTFEYGCAYTPVHQDLYELQKLDRITTSGVNEMKCVQCGRPVKSGADQWAKHGLSKCMRAVGIYYVHSGYGCDTGCCGHRFFAVTQKGDTVDCGFIFNHDRARVEAEARQLADQHHAEILHDRCELLENCDW